MRKILTYMMILTIAALPVHVINASVDVVAMQLNMSQQFQTKMKCLKKMQGQNINSDKSAKTKSCCAKQSHTCQTCNNCPQAVTALMPLLNIQTKSSLLKRSKFVVTRSALTGIPQKNLLRPPRTLI